MGKVPDIPVADVVSAYRNGRTMREIAGIYGCSVTPIHRRLTRAGINCRQPEDYKLAIPIKEVIADYASGASVHSLAKKFGCSDWTIADRLRAEGVDVVLRPHKHNIPSEEAVRLYLAGQSLNDLAARYSCTRIVIAARLRESGITLRSRGSQRKYAVDDTFFDCIDTEEKAYWLGFLLADGSISRSKDGDKLNLALALRDEKHVLKFRRALSAENPLHYWSRSEAVGLTISSTQLVESLEKLGCVQRKTGCHGTPKIPGELMRHMYRGYFDGDGCLSCWKANGSWRIDVPGARKFVEDFQAWLMSRTDVGKTKLKPVGRVVYLSYGGSRQVERIVDLLYAGAKTFLDRKYAKYLEFKNTRKTIAAA